MLKLIYCKEGTAFSDFGLFESAQNIVDDYLKGKHQSRTHTVKFSTESFITAVRVAMLRSGFNHSDVVFEYNNIEMAVNAKFDILNLAPGFWETELTLLKALRELRRGLTDISKNCKLCGCRMIWENPHILGHYQASSVNLEDWDICHECMVEHCVSTNCLGCEYGKHPDCRFLGLKQHYEDDAADSEEANACETTKGNLREYADENQRQFDLLPDEA
jgi:hypothetical protein